MTLGGSGVGLSQSGYHVGRANQRWEKPVAKLQPTTCVISQICEDKQMRVMTRIPPEGFGSGLPSPSFPGSHFKLFLALTLQVNSLQTLKTRKK